MTKKILGLLIIGLLLRFYLSYFQYSGDLNNHLVWANGFLTKPGGFFFRHFPGFNDANYPPLAIYFFALSRLLYNLTLSSSVFLNLKFSFFPSAIVPLLLNQNTQIAFMKLFPIICDVGSAYLIYLMTLGRRRTLIFCLYLFNPATVYLSSVWGQIESLPIFFMLLSLYLFKKFSSPLNIYLSTFTFLLAVLSKQTALWLLPIFLIYWLKNSKLTDFVKSLIVCLIGFVISYLPFLGQSSNFALTPFTIYLSTLAGSTGLANDRVWNLWDLVYKGVPTLDSTVLFFLSVRVWSLILVFVSLLFIVIYLFKQKITDKRLYLSLFLFSLAMFFFQTRVHEKHLAPALPFLFLLPLSKLSWTIVLIVAITIFFYLNLQFALGLPFI